jgi:hypothetical protein
MRRTKGLRYAAMRKAQQAKRERDAKRLRRERQVEAALAEYFEHVAVAEAVEAATAAKVAEVTAAGAAEAGRVRTAAAVAVRAMLDLGETRNAVAELTGLTLNGVRALANVAGGPDADLASVVVLDAAITEADVLAAESHPGGGHAAEGSGRPGDGERYVEEALPIRGDSPAWSELPDWARQSSDRAGDPYAA